MAEKTTAHRRGSSVFLRVWYDGVPGYSVVKMRPLGDACWWFDLVRVGSPAHRGLGLGSRTLEEGIRYAREALGATNIGLKPHPLGWRTPFDLDEWYRQHGFVHRRGDELWMRDPESPM